MAENILHYGGVRLRINGSGNCKMTFLGLDDINESSLLALPITDDGREPTRLSNFVSQRARLKLYTDNINEHVKVNRIIIFVKPIYSQFPM